MLLRRIDALDAIRKGPTGLGNEKPTAATTTWEDVCMGIKLAHERAFTKENVMAAWAAVGVRPFNRRVHRNLLGKENEAKVAATQARAVKVVTLAEARAHAGATSAAVLPVLMSQGRNTAGRINWERPLTHPGAVATRQKELEEKKKIEEGKQKKKDDAAADFLARGGAAAEKAIGS